MPYKTGTAQNYQDLLHQIRLYAGGFGVVTDEQYVGTGDGELQDLEPQPAAITETITIECTQAEDLEAEPTPIEGTFFTVTGSVSGALGDVELGELFEDDLLAVRIVEGSTPFEEGDTFTLEVEQGELSALDQAWDVLRYDDATTLPDNTPEPGEKELILRGPGSQEGEGVYVGLCTFSRPSQDQYALGFQGYTGHDPEASFHGQPGAHPSSGGSQSYAGYGTNYCPWMPVWNDPMPYWFIVNGRRIIVHVNVENLYMGCYLGLILPYSLPDQFPIPLYIGGSYAGSAENTRFDDTGTLHQCYAFGHRQGRLRNPAGAWMGRFDDVEHFTWPYDNTDDDIERLLVSSRPTQDGARPVYPCLLYSSAQASGRGWWGELEGVYAVPGFGIGSEDIVTIDSDEYVVFRNIFRTDFDDYVALKLE